MLRTLIIDDEALAREEMRRLLSAHDDVSIVGEAEEVPAAKRRLATPDYDLVLLDVQLAGGTGFDLVPEVASSARIIFVTAHDRFALRAFEVNALDYLLKPVSAARLASSLARAQTPPTNGASESADAPLGSLRPTDRVFLKNQQGARFVALNDVAAVVSCDNYSEVFVADGSHFLVRRSLKAWEGALPTEAFVRVHRQVLVNLGQVERIEQLDGDVPALWLRGVKRSVTCSHRLSPELRRRIERRT